MNWLDGSREEYKVCFDFFYVLLTVHLSIIFAINQT